MPPHYASLHAGLLARKGEAVPAIRPAAATSDNSATPPIRQPRPTPPPPPPVRPAKIDPAASSPTPPARARTTVRMTGDEQRRLRLAANKLGRSQQSLIQAAIATYLEAIARDEFPECACLKPKK